MIEEIVVVSKVENYQVAVQTERSSSCGKCTQSSACSSNILDKYIRKRDIVVDTDLFLKVGDKVLVGINESALLKGSLLLYIMPLFALFSGGIGGEFLAGFMPGFDADIIVAVSAMTVFFLSLLLLACLQRTFLIQHFARPVVLRKL